MMDHKQKLNQTCPNSSEVLWGGRKPENSPRLIMMSRRREWGGRKNWSSKYWAGSDKVCWVQIFWALAGGIEVEERRAGGVPGSCRCPLLTARPACHLPLSQARCSRCPSTLESNYMTKTVFGFYFVCSGWDQSIDSQSVLLIGNLCYR